MPADYTRIHRLLKILTLVQGRGRWTAPKLAAACGVVPRTIYRDLKALAAAGISCFYDPQSRSYQLPREFFMKPVELTLEESLALVALGEQVAGRRQIPFTGSAARAVEKIRSQLPESIRREIEQVEEHLAIQLTQAAPPDGGGVGDVYETVRRAIASRCALRCRYQSVNAPDTSPEFTFKPYSLLFRQRAWYVIGHHSGHRGVRCLKLTRFASLHLTDQPYAIPDSFSVRKHLGHAWRMIRGPKRYEVDLRFDADFAETIADTHWHDTQQIDWNRDGSIRFRCSVDGLDEVVWWVLSMGPHCRVVNPAELADRVKDLARQTIGQYA